MFPKFYNIFNYSTLAIAALILVLILTETVPRESYIPLIIAMIVILIARIVLRFYLNSYLKKSKGE